MQCECNLEFQCKKCREEKIEHIMNTDEINDMSLNFINEKLKIYSKSETQAILRYIKVVLNTIK